MRGATDLYGDLAAGTGSIFGESAAKGWAVFYPNYRGSTGRGVDFS